MNDGTHGARTAPRPDASQPTPFDRAERERWQREGWLRPLDVAFSELLLQLQPALPGSLLAAAVLLSHLESRGHSNLPLAGVPQGLGSTPEAASAASTPSTQSTLDGRAPLLGWPPEGTRAASERLIADLSDAALCRRDWATAGAAVLEIDPTEDTGTTPLVLDGHRLYLRRYWRHERRIAAAVHARVGPASAPAAATALDTAAAARWLQALFPPVEAAAASASASPNGSGSGSGSPSSAASASSPEPDWQAVACALALRGRLTVITGGPGTGKTYTAARLLVLLQALHDTPAAGAPSAAPLRVALAAPTGKAAARLKQSIDRALQELDAKLDAPTREALGLARLAASLPAARTVHRLLGARPDTRRMARDAAHPLDVDLLIVDEASMIHLEMMDALLSALAPTARLVLLGDKDQLASVEAGAVMGDLCAPGPAEAPEQASTAHTAHMGAAADQALSSWPADRPDAHGPDAAGPDPEPAAAAAHQEGAPPHGYDAETVAWITRLCGVQLPSPTPSPTSATAPAPALAQATVMLRRSRRFDGPIGQLALAVNAGRADTARTVFAEAADSAIAHLGTPDARQVARVAVDGRAGQPGSYRDYLGLLAEGPRRPGMAAHADWVRQVLQAFDRMRVLCALREGPWGATGLNAAIETALAEAGLLSARRDEWYRGRPVLVTRNDASLGLFNGDIGIVLDAAPDEEDRTAESHETDERDDRYPAGAPGAHGAGAPRAARAGKRRAWFEDAQGLRSVSVNRLADVQTAFAMTVHKSQGSEFGHVVLALPDRDTPVLTRELVYTGITRARRACTVVSGEASALERALGRRTRRLSGLSERLARPD